MQSETQSVAPTIVEDRRDGESLNGDAGRDLYPGPDEKKTHPYLVEFDENDPLDPKVSPFLLL